MSCKLDEVKGMEGNRQPMERHRQGQIDGETVGNRAKVRAGIVLGRGANKLWS